MNILPNLLLPPIHSDLGKTQKASFLHYAYIVIMVAFLVFGFLNLGWEAYSLGYTLLLFSGICLVGFILNKIKLYNLSAILLTILVYAGTYYNIIDGAGFHDPGIAALPVIILLSGILFEEFHVFLTTALSIIGLVAIYVLWGNGLLELSTPPTMNRLTILSILQVLTGILTGVVFNIQKNTIKSLYDSEERYRDLVENLEDLVFRYEFSPKEGFTYVSPSATKITGHTPMDFYLDSELGLQLIHPEDSPPFEDLFSSQSGFSEPITVRWVKNDGTVIWMDERITPFYDREGNLIAVEGIARDITERRKADDALRASEDRYRTIFEHAAVGISIHTGDIFIDINKAWQEMFGFSKEAVLGKTPFDFSPLKQPDGQISSEKGWDIINQASAGQGQLFEWRHIRSDGTEFDAEIFMTVINLSGEEVMISFVSDLTERRRAEAAALEERQRLAHELHDAVSQTLFSASMISQTLERSWEKDPKLVKENLNELQILTQGALAEMRNLLLELRPGALEHTPMPDLLHQLVEGFLGRTKTDIDLEIGGENPLPFNTRFVFFRIAQESLNNIIKHARANKVKVYYSSQPDQVELFIEDDGKGFNLKESVTGQHGLDIMKERAESINADINIDSKIGKGTTIKVTW